MAESLGAGATVAVWDATGGSSGFGFFNTIGERISIAEQPKSRLTMSIIYAGFMIPLCIEHSPSQFSSYSFYLLFAE
jgi:hypothetical protein